VLKAILFTKHAFIEKFNSSSSSFGILENWVNQHWTPLLQGTIKHIYCGKGFYSFMFVNKKIEIKKCICGPWFMGASGIYLNPLSLSFDPKNEVPMTISIYIRVSFLPLIFIVRNGTLLGQTCGSIQTKFKDLYL
jgi:hypothetical protein